MTCNEGLAGLATKHNSSVADRPSYCIPDAMRIRKDDVDVKNIDWHKWGLSAHKKPIDGGDGFLYCCKEGLRLFKANSHKACRYHNETIRDKGTKL